MPADRPARRRPLPSVLWSRVRPRSEGNPIKKEMISNARPGWCDNLVHAGELQAGERVLVVVDEPLFEEGAELAAASRLVGASARLELWSGERPLERPPPQVLGEAADADLVLFMLPAPHRDGAQGVLVADLTVPYTLEGLVDEPVVVRFERGRAVSIDGGRAAAMLRELVANAGKGADVIAELGIGLNPAVTPRGHVMLDEKAGGTAHVAIGRNTGPYGGDNEASIHVDCVFSAPVVEADGRPVQIP